MNEIEKEIEEMARCIAFELCPKRHAHANWGEKAQCYSDNNFTECKQIKNVVDKLYNAGYRNCKDKVVLSKEELNMLIGNIEKSSEIKAEELEKVRKETAREIIEMLVPPCEACDENWHKGCLCLRTTIAEKIAKQYRVEVE